MDEVCAHTTALHCDSVLNHALVSYVCAGFSLVPSNGGCFRQATTVVRGPLAGGAVVTPIGAFSGPGPLRPNRGPVIVVGGK